jgi:amidase
VEEKRPVQLANAPDISSSMFDVTGPGFFRNLLQTSGTSLSDATQLLRDLTNLPILSDAQKAVALARRDSFQQALLDFMQDYDLILCPVSPFIAPLHTADPIVDPSYTFPYNLAGFPAAVVRAGTSSLGLPIGVQIVGRPWEEHVVLAAAHFLETALGGWKPVPSPILKLLGSPKSLSFSWKGYGTLQSSDAVAGKWKELPKAASPYRVTNGVPAQFYRLRQ